MTTKNLSIQTDEALIHAIDFLAEKEARSRNDIVNRALERFVAEEADWDDKVRKGLQEAERSEFASDEEVERVLSW